MNICGFTLPKEIDECMSVLKSAKIDAYLVGGCVRDILMHRIPHDYDITVNVPPEKIRELFKNTADTGIKHGTITVIINRMPIEITQMRHDGNYQDHRHPTNITPAKNINDDLVRRDFTVNALCVGFDGKVVDITDGIDDLDKKIIRAVGLPENRFCEDALRIMRAFRFCSQLGFTLEQNTKFAALKTAHLLENISAERIYSELCKTLCGENPEIIADLLDTNSLSVFGMPKPDNSDRLKILCKLECDIPLRLSAFIIICGYNEKTVCQRLKCSNQVKNEVYFYCSQMRTDNVDYTDCITLKRMLDKVGYDKANKFFKLYELLKNTDISTYSATLKRYENEPIKISQLAVSGAEILKIASKPSQVGKILCALQEYVWLYPEKNSVEYLQNIAKTIANSYEI